MTGREVGGEVPRKRKKVVKGLAGVKFGKMSDANNMGLSLQTLASAKEENVEIHQTLDQTLLELNNL
ncbi:tropomyosin beta chain isoform X4 [Prionailurus iriomotensis]